MTLRKVSARKIVVGNDEYKWFLSATVRGTIVLVAEHGQAKGQKLEVHIESDINDFWVEFSNVDDLNLKYIKPKEVAMIITEAIEQGWKPRQMGKPLVYNWIDNKLVMR